MQRRRSESQPRKARTSGLILSAAFPIASSC